MSKKPLFAATWALVTGASSGLGEQFARSLAHRGAHLLLSGRNRDKLASLAADLATINGVQTRVVVSDLSDPAGIHGLLREVTDLGVFVEHVINNAGFGYSGHFLEEAPAQQEQMVQVNVLAPLLLARHFLPRMTAKQCGGIINVASTAAYQPVPFMATYGATKAFVLSFSQALRAEAEPSGVRVLTLCPGSVLTQFQERAGIPAEGLLKIALLDAQSVVRAALEAYEVNRAVCVPGLVNSAQTTLARILPQRLVTQASKVAMRRMGRI